MDKTLFKKDIPGKLIEIKILGARDWAFIPSDLPSRFEPDIEIWPLLAEAKEEMARLDGIGRHMPNYELLLKPLQQREAIKSSSLEGTYATPEQLLLFEIEPREPKSTSDQINAWLEVHNYNKALRRGQQLLEEIPVSLRLIKELHSTLLTGVRGQNKTPGEFRKRQVHIGSDRRFIPPPPRYMMECLYRLETYINETKGIDPLIFCFLVHYQFETIHPFSDGNGRVGRLLLSLMIYKWCSLRSPWLYLSAFFERYKDEYIDNLFNVSAKNDWKSWIKFCLRATVTQAKDAICRFDNLVELRESYLSRIAKCQGHIRLRRIIEELFESPILTIPRVVKLCRVSYPTAKKDIDNLVKQGIISQGLFPNRPKVFMAKEIIDIIHRPLDL